MNLIPWGTFDVESYKEMSLTERCQELRNHREILLSELRNRIANYQADALLNPHLSDADRHALHHSKPISGDFDGVNGVEDRYKPQPPRSSALSGYDEPEGDGLLA